ncbi:hypothetical protein JD844_006357 [Phrynosoma platyrhinos]|uniref:ATP-dependent RNA helicase SUV3 DEXQ-box helicase domain-containing protein n=1 Tax=Phrynosoma platyrhinos TaxID=52577 RepID=A0ABQ7T1W0_PHRPL|nr:hypothetical protein JD844_006357 [Phrynosoma platyrhinos]
MKEKRRLTFINTKVNFWNICSPPTKGYLQIEAHSNCICSNHDFTWIIRIIELLCLDEVAVIDEIQMIKDPSRGWAWTRALLGLCAEEIHVCGEAAAINLVTELMYTTGEEVEVRNYKRLTPIKVLDEALESLDKLRPGDCIVCFSKNDIYSVSRQIEARGLECAVIYGSLPPGIRKPGLSKEKLCFMLALQTVEKPIMQSRDI